MCECEIPGTIWSEEDYWCVCQFADELLIPTDVASYVPTGYTYMEICGTAVHDEFKYCDGIGATFDNATNICTCNGNGTIN